MIVLIGKLSRKHIFGRHQKIKPEIEIVRMFLIGSVRDDWRL